MFQSITVEGKIIFTFIHKLDTVNCANKENDILTILSENSNDVEFDMTGVDYISSNFLRICTMVAKRLNPNKLKITNTTPNVKKVFKIAGFDQVMDIV